jgi:hypothetical protein
VLILMTHESMILLLTHVFMFFLLTHEFNLFLPIHRKVRAHLANTHETS